MKIINKGKLETALKPKVASPIIAMQIPSMRLRRVARSAKKPDGKLATPAINVRAEANMPAWASVSPSEAVISGKMTAITPLKRVRLDARLS